MEIEINASRVPQSGYTEITRRQAPAQSAPTPDVVHTAENLQDKLKSPMVRPDAVAEARKLAEDEKYPPDDVMDRIAILLAIQMGK